ncbi:MAG: DNA-directed RNA polymerase subunit P [Candidatus Diapherotrites archaeon]|uniref:DNA-directed RNA polymerase subunit Rpo12 n=1 Tax=Candidatus Iainarchaeum sp. TaxID=3101447 RepID=A0A8T4L8G4_9ARCH|nr:DNA-directed RNA polymerase subunit P [Candidatus Diapherotrites archaeon]
MYKCGKCGTMIESIAYEVRCPNCAYKILYKQRSSVVKEVMAR